MRIAFFLRKHNGWTGGLNYLRNLLDLIKTYSGGEIEAILYCDEQIDSTVRESFQNSLLSSIRILPSFSISRTFVHLLKLRNHDLEHRLKQDGIDVVFQSGIWLGFHFGIPTLAWIPDFQHKHLPQMFSKVSLLKRDLGYRLLSRSATTLMVSSRDAERDWNSFYSHTKKPVCVFPFCVNPGNISTEAEATIILKKYELNDRFIYLPNQLWKHKNHVSVLKALSSLKKRGILAKIVATGSPTDYRNPKYPESLLSLVKFFDLEDYFVFLGLIPIQDVPVLMRCSVAVMNPSLFEGWSTTVEEAKSIGTPLLLSSIDVHREQANGKAVFFDPRNVTEIADTIEYAMSDEFQSNHPKGNRTNSVKIYEAIREQCYENFESILYKTTAMHSKN